MVDILLATSAELPDGEPGGELIVEDLASRGLEARWAVWDDPAVDWSGARLVAIRSTWDYEQRLPEFLDWARAVGPGLVNSAEVLAWNTDKEYLVGLAELVPVVPTVSISEEGDLAPVLADFMPAVVKPRVGAGGRGVVVFDGEPGGPGGVDESQLGIGPWVVQPLVESVRTEGEASVFVFAGRAHSCVRKRPAGEEIRVHEEWGGSSVAAELTAEAATVAEKAVGACEQLLGQELPYARVDLMRDAAGALVVSEVEATEPGLYLDLVPENAAGYGAVLEQLLDRPGAEPEWQPDM